MLLISIILFIIVSFQYLAPIHTAFQRFIGNLRRTSISKSQWDGYHLEGKKVSYANLSHFVLNTQLLPRFLANFTNFFSVSILLSIYTTLLTYDRILQF